MSENETITPGGAGESGQKKAKHFTAADIEASNQRMRDLLRNIDRIADKALAEEPFGVGTCWRHLSKALSDIRKAMRPEPGTLAFEDEWAWYENQIEELRAKYGAESRVPVAGCETPLDPNAPEMVRGENPWKPLWIPECGIDFKRYHSAECETYICAWNHGNQSHVYEVRCRKVEEGKWVATLSNDGRELCTLSAASRQLAYRCALGAMRNYLRRGHRKTLKHAKEAKSLELGAESLKLHPAPLTPEEELAGTVARQKEVAE